MNKLDHILGPWEQKIFTTSFYNFVSDHKAIVLRISLSEGEFIENEILKDFQKRKQMTLDECSISLSKTIKDQNQDSENDIKTKRTKSTKRQRSSLP